MIENKNFSGKRILVTGGAGFIGGNFIRRILKNSNAVIYNLDKLGYSSDKGFEDGLFHNRNKNIPNNYFFLKVDLADQKNTELAIEKANPDWVINFAAESHVDRSINNPDIFLKSNVLGTFNLLKSSKDHWNKLTLKRKNDFRFLHISTDEVFGSLGEKGSFNEFSPYKPSSPYSASKAASDHLVNSWRETYDFPTLITNCSNNFGPYQYPDKLIPLAIMKGINKESIPMYGNGLNIRDWLYVEDHIDAILLVLLKGVIGNSYCIGGHGERTNENVLSLICKLLNDYWDNSFDHVNLIKKVKDRPGHDYRYAINSTKIYEQLGWEPYYSFEKGIEETVLWYINNLDWCKKILEEST